MIQEIRSQRPLITAWVQMGKPFAMEGNTLHVRFPSDQKMSVESLNKANTRKFLEGLLTKLAGRAVDLKLELGEVSEAPAPPSYGRHAPAESPGTPQQSVAETPASAGTQEPTADSMDMFKNDPLIQKALKIFAGEVRSVEGPR